MGVPIFGINIPVPKIKIAKRNLEKYADLYRGIRDRKDTVSWRTLIITIRELLGDTSADNNKISTKHEKSAITLIKQLVKGTYLEALLLEIAYAVGVPQKENKKRTLDILLLSGRHYPEPLIWNLADYAKKMGNKVAVINPVGHYNDGQTRVIGPYKYFAKIKKLIILSSTQSKNGGSISVLANTIKLIRNPDVASRCGSIEVIIPMFGGSRGHRFGQDQEVGYEVMEAGFNAQVLSLVAKDVFERLAKEKINCPPVRFSTIDIHNPEYPKKTFNEYGFNFVSINSSGILAKGITEIIRSKHANFPIKLIACDKGAVPRTLSLAKDMLLHTPKIAASVQIIYIEKKRLTAGVIAGTQISKIEELRRTGRQFESTVLKVPKKASFINTVLVYSDDMIDTGGTAEKDLSFISNLYPNSSLKIFAASHPVFSKGFGAIKKIGADAYVLGNSLSWDGIEDVKGVELVDFSEAIYDEIIQ